MKPPTRFQPSTILAGLALGLVVSELLSGLCEALSYKVGVDHAYGSVVAMRSSPFGAFLAGIHYWGSAALLLISAFLILALLWEGGYADKSRWFGTLGLCVAAFAFQVTGNLLPMDRHGVQTAVVESGITGAAPGFGSTAREFMLAGSHFDAPTLTRWWLGHAWILPLVALICAVVTARSFRPKVGWVVASIAVVALFGLLIPAPLGLIATKADFGQYNATVSWYTWPFHGLMNAFDKLSPSAGWVGSIALPTALFIALLLMPWMGSRLSVRFVRGMTAAVILAGFAIAVCFGGSVAKLTGNRDPAALATSNVSGKSSTDPRVVELVASGHLLFNSKGCSGCHGKDGANGDSGPDLTTEWKQHSDPQWYVKLIRNPKSVTPSATMPAFPQLRDDEVLAIGTYLSQPPKK